MARTTPLDVSLDDWPRDVRDDEADEGRGVPEMEERGARRA